MEYNDNFKQLLRHCLPDGYIGHGNPNAKILILGQEPAHDFGSSDYTLEIANNQMHWEEMVKNNRGVESINFNNVCYGTPLWPWANQRFTVRSKITKENDEIIWRGENGTAKTWYNYQKLVFELLKREPIKDGLLEFHKYSFHTDMSARASKKHENIDREAAKQSVRQRAEKLFSTDFFRCFPIIIAPVGHFPRDIYGDTYFHKAFGVKYRPEESEDWINVNIRETESPQILIHCKQIAYASNEYIHSIALVAQRFAEKHKINLEKIQF